MAASQMVRLTVSCMRVSKDKAVVACVAWTVVPSSPSGCGHRATKSKKHGHKHARTRSDALASARPDAVAIFVASLTSPVERVPCRLLPTETGARAKKDAGNQEGRSIVTPSV